MNQGIAITPLDAAAILIVLAAALGYLNHRFLGLPQSVGLTVMGALASLIVVGIDRLLPASTVGEDVLGFITGIDFQAALMDGTLSFLLFAGVLFAVIAQGGTIARLIEWWRGRSAVNEGDRATPRSPTI